MLIVEDPTVTKMWNYNERIVLFLFFDLCISDSVILDSLSCSFTGTSVFFLNNKIKCFKVKGRNFYMWYIYMYM